MSWRASVLIAALALTGSRPAAGDAPCVEVPEAAQKVFASLVRAMRRGDAAAVVDLMTQGDDARLGLRLAGVRAGHYSREQALEVLRKDYFARREVLSMTESEGCTKGTETRLTRTYKCRVREGGNESDGTIAVTLAKVKDAWFLLDLTDS